MKKAGSTTSTTRRIVHSRSAPVPLAVAASLVYHHLNRNVGNPAAGEAYVNALNSTALALSHVSDIYALIDGTLVRIPADELAAGRFEGGADTYRTAGGKVYRVLSMRRIDVMQALAILGKARAAIDSAKVKASR